jgi:RND family efflux transporter MFP subunit
MSDSKEPRSKALAAGVAVLVVLLVLAVVALSRPERSSVSAASAARKDLLVPILADGTLETPEGGDLRAPERARVAELPVPEGARVRRGDVLVRLESPTLTTRSRDASSLASDLQAERVRAESDLAAARSEAARLRKVVESDRRLIAEGAIPRATLEADEAGAAAAEGRVRAGEARLVSLAGARVELAAESSKELARRTDQLTVRAPADGVVFNLPRRVGESVEEGQLVASVSDPDRRGVRVRVDQPDLPRIAPGERMVVSFDGLPERRWNGRVTLVSPGLREVEGRHVGEVLGEIADPASQLPPNALVNVQLVVAEKKAALVVPRGALGRDGERRFVWILSDGRARRRDVTVGLVAPNEVEITGGLSEGDRVLLPGAVPLSEGLRVAAR